jgi:hypothetical protein
VIIINGMEEQSILFNVTLLFPIPRNVRDASEAVPCKTTKSYPIFWHERLLTVRLLEQTSILVKPALHAPYFYL